MMRFRRQNSGKNTVKNLFEQVGKKCEQTALEMDEPTHII